MILNIAANNGILKEKLDINLPNLTILTGENGAGKTQLLTNISNCRNGYIDIDCYQNYPLSEINTRFEKTGKQIFPLTDNNGDPLTDIFLSNPGLTNTNHIFNNEEPLINQVVQEWAILKPICAAYSYIKEKNFLTIEDEISALNTSIRQLSSDLNIQKGSNFPNNVITVSYSQINKLKEVAKNSNKSIYNITYIDFLTFYEIPTNIFSSALTLLFHQYSLKKKYYPKLIEQITAPWVIFNRILESANFNYRVEYDQTNDENYPLPLKLVDKNRGISNVTIDSLSSGEKTIMALIFVLFHSSNNGIFPQVILFDEPDAHLHPSLTQLFLNVIQDVLIKEHNVNVILTTHSPSTVALSPVVSIYKMERELGYPIKESKSNAIQSLSEGLASVTIEEGYLGIDFLIKSTDKNIVFTEGITDMIILKVAWEKLYGKENKLPFIIEPTFGASFLRNLFQNAPYPDGLFDISPNRIMIALFDFDSAGYSAWKEIWKNKNPEDKPLIIENNPKKCLTKKHSKKNGYTMLLPVPDIPIIEKQVLKGKTETFEENSLLTIESLLFDVKNFKKLYYKEEILPGGGSLYKFIGDKKKFANQVQNLKKEDFSHFQPLFSKIISLFENSI